MNHVLNLDFTKFYGAEIITRENSDGEEVEGIFIPFELNEFKKGRKGSRFASFYVIQKKNDFYYHQTHYVIPRISKDHRAFLNFLGFKKQYMGHLTPCYDEEMNKLTKKYSAMAKKGYVKVDKIQEVDD